VRTATIEALLEHAPREQANEPQETVESAPEPTSAARAGLSPAGLLALQPSVGNAALARHIANGSAPASIQRVPDWLGDVLDTRDNEEYLDATEDLASFKRRNYTETNFQSSTHLGMFDVLFNPNTGALQITCKVKFSFVNGSATQFPGASAADLTWTDAVKADWKSRYLSTVSAAWSGGHHIFHCQKDWWEALTATTTVQFVETERSEHFNLSITKIPPGGFRQSSVTRPDSSWLGDTPGSGDFDSEDLTPTAKPGGTQVGAVHEAGHMLGLDDEYGTGTPDHSGLVQSEFGHGVARGADGRIMSGGMEIQPEHGVTFLEALKSATSMQEWSHIKKFPKPVPGAAAAPGASPAPAAGVTPPGPPGPPPSH
jgi:hypothetical protein